MGRPLLRALRERVCAFLEEGHGRGKQRVMSDRGKLAPQVAFVRARMAV